MNGETEHMSYAWKHFKTITKHKYIVMQYCFRMGLVGQGLTHDLSKYSPTEFRAGARYWQGDRSPNNAEREATGVSNSWLHHKGRNRHHFEYWIDYDLNAKELIGGMPIPRKYVAEMIADRIGASTVYLGEKYDDTAPYIYLTKSIDELWFVHEDVKEQLIYLLAMLAARGEDATMLYIRYVYLHDPEAPWVKPADYESVREAAEEKIQSSGTIEKAFSDSEKKGNLMV